MQITVTQEHIKRGVSCSAESCPIALAIRDMYPNAEFITVSVEYLFIRFKYEDDSAVFKAFLPWDAQSFVKNFDLGLDVDPFSFSVEALRLHRLETKTLASI